MALIVQMRIYILIFIRWTWGFNHKGGVTWATMASQITDNLNVFPTACTGSWKAYKLRISDLLWSIGDSSHVMTSSWIQILSKYILYQSEQLGSDEIGSWLALIDPLIDNDILLVTQIKINIATKQKSLIKHWRAIAVPGGICLLNMIDGIRHDDVIKWKHFPRYRPFVWGIHRSPVISPHKSQWRGALIFSLICAWINGSVNNREAGDLRRYCAHYDVIVMWWWRHDTDTLSYCRPFVS